MRFITLFLAFLITVITSCSSVYKAGQTPDDIYFSAQPPPIEAEYVNTNNENNYSYYGDEEYYSDRHLRMKVQNRARWSQLDDWYSNDRSSYSYYNNYSWNNPWSPNLYWNTFYNPYYSSFGYFSPYSYYSPYGYGGGYYSPVVVAGGKINYSSTVVSNRPRMYNLNTYNNNLTNQNNYTIRKVAATNPAPQNSSNQRYGNYNNSGRSAGNYLRNSSKNSSNESNNNSSNYNINNSGSSSRSSTSSGSSSAGSESSSQRSSGGTAPVRRF